MTDSVEAAAGVGEELARARAAHGLSVADVAQQLKFAGADRLRMEAKMPEWPQRVQAAKDLLGALAA